MNIQMYGKDIEITDGLHSAVNDAVQKLRTFNLMNVNVTLEVLKNNEQVASITTSVPNHSSLHATHKDTDMYVSIGMVVDKLRSQLEKIRDKSKNVKRDVIVDQIVDDEE